MPRKQTEGIYKRKDSPYWWASYTNGRGKRIRRSTGVPVGRDGEQEAEALLGKWKVEAHQQRMWGVAEEDASDPTFDEVMLTYIKGHKVRAKQDRRIYSLKQLYPFFSGKRMSEITDMDVKAYVRNRLMAVGPATINREVGTFSAACNFCRDEMGMKIDNPAKGKKLKEPEGRVRWLDENEANRLLDAARARPRAHWLVDFVQLCIYTGMRKSEATELTWDRVDIARRIVLLETGTTKSGKRRSIPLHQVAVQALESRLAWRNANCPESTWVFCNSKGQRIADMKKSFASALKAAGIKDFRQHDQRHTLASWMVMSGTELIRVRDMLGHASIEQTQRYAHLHPEVIREAVDNLVPARNGHAMPKTKNEPVSNYGKSQQIH